MIQPVLQDDAFLEDLARTPSDRDHFQLWWLGQSGFLIQWERRHLLFDPYLSDSLTKKYANTDKPHVRMSERIIAPERLDFIDIVTSSHNHTDHLDAETLIPILQRNRDIALIIGEANRDFVAERLKVSKEFPIGLNADDSVVVKNFKITAVPSAHESLEADERGRHKFLGFVTEFGPWTVYHSGDTVLYDGLAERLRRWKIDVALLPINGRAPERRVAGNLNGREAAALGKEIGARMVIPCHYEMFEFNTASPEEFAQKANSISQHYCVLRAGQRWSSGDLK